MRIAVVAHHPGVLVVIAMVLAIVIALRGLVLALNRTIMLNHAAAQHEERDHQRKWAEQSQTPHELLQLLLRSAG